MSAECKDEEAIFNAAIKLQSSAERDAYLKDTCGDDAGLLNRLGILLKPTRRRVISLRPRRLMLRLCWIAPHFQKVPAA